ncbi:MAG: hypothetical protein HYY24_28655 [Verrucomicrobia bacterium]|nr:hypothetical protein [Verrucomicrobiota bacterium]
MPATLARMAADKVRPSRAPPAQKTTWPFQEESALIHAMSAGAVQRKLADIMFTDVVGYLNASGAQRNEPSLPRLRPC